MVGENQLILWKEQPNAGDSLTVPAKGGQPVRFDVAYTSFAATNNTRMAAELYATPDRSGEPVAVLNKGQTALFPTGHDVRAIAWR